jgi:prolyl oligopeptidase
MAALPTHYKDTFPYVKLITFSCHRYHTLLAGASWMAEYGNPDDESEWAFLQRCVPITVLADIVLVVWVG